jgi:3-phosphoshikimate 1-carboxyvinyltransferase
LSGTSESGRVEAARAVASGGRFTGRLCVPPSKSVTNRLLNLALLSGRPVVLSRPLISEDTERFLAALVRLGFDARRDGDELHLTPGALPPEATIDCGESGTMARFMLATLTTLPGRWRLDGAPRLRERTVAPLAEALERLGAGISYRGRHGFLPLDVSGGSLRGGSTPLDAGASSQFASALLMAAARARSEVTLSVHSLVSSPYVELTRSALAAFGAVVEAPVEGALAVRPTALGGGRFEVEGDYSAASYPAAAAALTGGEIELAGLAPDSAQGDRGFVERLLEMGAEIEWRDSVLVVRGTGALRALDADMASMPDMVPTLAALAPFAAGTTRIRNVPHLRIKESDRLAAIASELRRAGADVEELEDGLVIPGGWAEDAPPSGSVRLSSHGDHRIAMAFAVLGLRRPGVEIAAPGVVAKSYPNFWRDFEDCCGR